MWARLADTTLLPINVEKRNAPRPIYDYDENCVLKFVKAGAVSGHFDLARLEHMFIQKLLLVIGVLFSLPHIAPHAIAQTRRSPDRVEQLQLRLDNGESKLEYDERLGYLPALLKAMEIPTDSQMLVFSKTSFQRRHISPRTPRAIYFNDTTYLGWVPNGEAIEISTVHHADGAAFYTLRNEFQDQPQLVRNRSNCLTCHHSTRTRGVAGHLVRSVYTNAAGQPHMTSTFRTNHDSPFEQRWGGWYVTGTHGKMRHLGNAWADNRLRPRDVDVEAGANIEKLKELNALLKIDEYLTPHSDIVALMVLEHQTDMHNLLHVVASEARKLARSGPDSSDEVLEAAIQTLLEYALFVHEPALTSPIRGTSTFAQSFPQRGANVHATEPKSSKPSLRRLNLKTRLFEYPCSYLIDSESFHALPALAKQRIADRLWLLLTHQDQSAAFAKRSRGERDAIRKILVESGWRQRVTRELPQAPAKPK